MNNRKIALLSFFLLPASALFAQNFIINTYAGNGTGGFSGDSGMATMAELSDPSGIAADDSGNVYIADYQNERIRKVNKSGIITTIAGFGVPPNNYGYSGDGGPAVKAKLYIPYDVAVDNNGNIDIADQGNNVIRMINKSGIISTIVGNGKLGYMGDGGLATGAELDGPSGVFVDTKGNLYISDKGNERIRKVNSKGIISTIAGNGTNGFSGDSGPATLAEFNEPTRAVVDRYGNVYIVDYGNNRIRKIDTNGFITTVASGLYAPTAVTVDTIGNVYVCDYGHDCISMLNTKGVFSVIAGTYGVSGYYGDGGAATAAKISLPDGVFMSSSGTIYIAEYGNNIIRELYPGPAGINEMAENSFSNIFPNPGNGIFNFQLIGNKGKSLLEIYNILGEKVYDECVPQTQHLNAIDISSQPAGIYLYRITTENGDAVGSGKLIIQ